MIKLSVTIIKKIFLGGRRMHKPLAVLSLAGLLSLSACGGGGTSEEATTSNNEEAETSEQTTTTNSEETEASQQQASEITEESNSEMNHSSTSETPEGLQEAENPTFKVGSKAIIQADHMEGMKGAEATIVGAYDTTAYMLTYTPTTGGEPVANHKWIIHEELEGAGEEPLAKGAEVTINANHMEGMNGAKATIESAEQTTVYMVDFTPTTGGEPITNHKWLVESELSAE